MVELRWNIREGNVVTVNKINIIGNEVTHERVIREAVVLYPGQVFSREALIRALTEYEGAVILISHDRHLVEATADRLWLVKNGTVKSYDGDMENYRTDLLAERGRFDPTDDEPEAVRAEVDRGEGGIFHGASRGTCLKRRRQEIDVEYGTEKRRSRVLSPSRFRHADALASWAGFPHSSPSGRPA